MQSYKKENRKVLYLSPELSELFDAYSFSRYNQATRRKNRTGNFIVNCFFQSMPQEKKKQLISEYNAWRKQETDNHKTACGLIDSIEHFNRVLGYLKRHLHNGTLTIVIDSQMVYGATTLNFISESEMKGILVAEISATELKISELEKQLSEL